MAIGKYLSLEEARVGKKLDRFVREHPSDGDESKFDDLLNVMAKTPVKVGQTSSRDDDAC